MNATDIQAAYDAGKATAGRSIDDIVYGDLAPEWIFEDFTANQFFEIGRQGYNLPDLVYGWRYGDVPECSRSRNYREGRLEDGVSVMQLDGEDKIKTLSELRGSFDNRPKIRVSGYRNPLDDGGDGEPLLLACSVAT
ncbi:MAG: hypothetical protein O7A04_03465 [Acidobacteria bacterium]|nr:hypothetical protein [Acidobacteriota bacterium]